MTLTKDDRRKIAALNTIPGYQLLIDKVVKLKREEALTKLRLASGRDERLDTAVGFIVWDDVVTFLTSAPRDIQEALKAEGDEVYG